MTTPTTRIAAMTVVACPLCDGPARVGDGEDVLDCPACAIRVDLAPDTRDGELPAAA